MAKPSDETHRRHAPAGRPPRRARGSPNNPRPSARSTVKTEQNWRKTEGKEREQPSFVSINPSFISTNPSRSLYLRENVLEQLPLLGQQGSERLRCLLLVILVRRHLELQIIGPFFNRNPHFSGAILNHLYNFIGHFIDTFLCCHAHRVAFNDQTAQTLAERFHINLTEVRKWPAKSSVFSTKSSMFSSAN